MTNIDAIRADFPILQRMVHGKPLAYLDNAASSQKPLAVLQAMDDYYRQTNANVHRGVHTLSEEATALYEGARGRIGRFINAGSSKEIIFTRNATEAINLVAYSWGLDNLKPGDEVLITEMEHHADIVPWQLITQRTGATLRYVPLDERGNLRFDLLEDLLNERTRIFAFVAMSNVLGTMNPVAELVEKAHAVGALALVDAAQSVPHMPVDVQALGCDFLVFSSHKMCGPTGIGVLWGRRELLEEMPPFMGGGDMIREVRMEGSRWNTLPWKFEAGTPAIAEVIGLGAAVDYLNNLGMSWVREQEHTLVSYAVAQLSQIEGLRLIGPEADQRGGVAAFTLDDVHPHDIAAILDSEGIAIRAGHHCAQPIHDRFGIVATARASFYFYNTTEEIDRLVTALDKVQSVFSIETMDQLYREAILDHYKYPRHKGHLDSPDISYHDHNPFCGDEITIELKIVDGAVAEAAFDGRGCAISQASASMMTEEIIGKSLEELKGWSKDDILELLGIEIGPVRLKCALLPLKALKAGVWGVEDWPHEE